MIPTIEYIKRKFNEYNGQMFGGRLPQLPIVLGDAATFLGQCIFKLTRMPDGSVRYSDFKMRINTRVDYPQEVVNDTIIHEMIHYFILYNGLRDTAPHGRIFQSIMHSINDNYGRHITVSRKISAQEREQAVSQKRTWHIIAAITFSDGKRGVKVLPRVAEKVAKYYNAVSAHHTVKRVDLYLHNDSYFNRFPTSAALRVHEIEESILLAHLNDAHPLRLDGIRLLPLS